MFQSPPTRPCFVPNFDLISVQVTGGDPPAQAFAESLEPPAAENRGAQTAQGPWSRGC